MFLMWNSYNVPSTIGALYNDTYFLFQNTVPKVTFALRQACMATAVGSTSAASSIDIESGILKQKSAGWQ